MKYARIDAQRQAFPLSEMCDVLKVSPSGYRAWKRGGMADRQRLTDSQMLTLIRAIHAELKGAYGSPRMVRELRTRGFPASKDRVEPFNVDASYLINKLLGTGFLTRMPQTGAPLTDAEMALITNWILEGAARN